MKVHFLIIILILLCLTGCGQKPPNSVLDETLSADSEESINTDTTEPDIGDGSFSHPNDPVIFDFAVLPEEEFPRGMWAVNQLAEFYGEPISVKSDPYFIITATFKDVEVTLKTIYGYDEVEEFKIFSFYNDVNHALSAKESNDDEHFESLEFELNEADKNLQLRVLNLSISDRNQEFPDGIEIGKSAKAQIIDSYPADSQDYDKEDELAYRYNFRDENGNMPEPKGTTYGSIIYMFDEDEVLKKVSIWWHWFSK